MAIKEQDTGIINNFLCNAPIGHIVRVWFEDVKDTRCIVAELELKFFIADPAQSVYMFCLRSSTMEIIGQQTTKGDWILDLTSGSGIAKGHTERHKIIAIEHGM